MKKFITIIFIIIVFFPMIIYLNPFIWGMKRMPQYQPTSKTTALIAALNKKYNMEIEIGEVVDTLWYFRDLKNSNISKLENFELTTDGDSYKDTKLDSLKKYVGEFITDFEHKHNFDSINVSIKYDSIIYKTKMK